MAQVSSKVRKWAPDDRPSARNAPGPIRGDGLGNDLPGVPSWTWNAAALAACAAALLFPRPFPRPTQTAYTTGEVYGVTGGQTPF